MQQLAQLPRARAYFYYWTVVGDAATVCPRVFVCVFMFFGGEGVVYVRRGEGSEAMATTIRTKGIVTIIVIV